jgi:hypothetical protein
MTSGMAHVWVRSADNESARLDVITWLRCRVGEVETERSDGALCGWQAGAACLISTSLLCGLESAGRSHDERRVVITS